jgi:hypothetical protein
MLQPSRIIPVDEKKEGGLFGAAFFSFQANFIVSVAASIIMTAAVVTAVVTAAVVMTCGAVAGADPVMAETPVEPRRMATLAGVSRVVLGVTTGAPSRDAAMIKLGAFPARIGMAVPAGGPKMVRRSPACMARATIGEPVVIHLGSSPTGIGMATLAGIWPVSVARRFLAGMARATAAGMVVRSRR